ncbi:MAG: ATP12 family protein [Pseudomonadota bacterium]
MKRFWDQVSVEAGAIYLDGKPVRTPGRAPLILANPALADAVAGEWRAVSGEIDPRAMPLTGLANAAIDRISPDPAAFAATLAKYGESDLLYYRAADPPELAARQAAAWNPLLDWAERYYDVQFELAHGVMPRAQPEATVVRLGEAIAARGAFELAGLSPVVTITGSLVLALALSEAAAAADTIWYAAQLDEAWSVERWGEDELAAQATAARRAEFDAAVRFLGLL